VGPTLIPLSSEATFVGTASATPQTTGGSYILSADSASYVQVQVPQNVGVQSMYVKPGVYYSHFHVPDPTAVTTLLISQLDAASQLLSTYYWTPGDGFVPLSPQTQSVTIGNTSTAPDGLTGVALVWGIEG